MRRHSSGSASSASLALLGLGVATLGCARILGVDDYKVGPPNAAACGTLSVPLKDGTCGPVGAVAIDCPNGFEVRDGACLPFFPAAPCEPGFRASPGDSACKPLDVACSSTGFGVFATGGVYVQQGASGTGDDRTSPVGTITEGIARAKELGKLDVWIASGTYAGEAPIVMDRPIRLQGSCTGAVTLQGRPGQPVVEISPGGSGAQLTSLSITGGSTGIRVTGATNVRLSSAWIHDLDGPGVVLEGAFDRAAEAPGGLLLPDGGLRANARMEPLDAGVGPSAGGTLDNVTVERVKGSGVEIWGSDATLTRVVVRDVAPLSELLPGRGVGVHPSAVAYPSWQPRRSKVDVRRTAITSVHSAGILIEGSDALIEESLVATVLADATGRGAGVVVQPRIATNVPATLEARHMLVEHTHDAGIRIWSSHTTLDTVTVRDTGEGPGGSCTGNGLRVLLDSTADKVLGAPRPEAALVEIHRSVFERTRESAVHVGGARVDIDSSIVRGTLRDSCDKAYGDGIAAYSFPDRPAVVNLARTRVDGSARAGIASFGARVSVIETALGCNVQGVARLAAAGAFTADTTTRCGCGETWAGCEAVADAALAPALRGATGCEAADACMSTCLTDWFGNADVTRLPGATLWVDGDERRAPAFTRKDGCVELGGTPGSTRMIASSAPGYLFILSAGPPWASRNFGVQRTAGFSLHTVFVEGSQTYGEQFDFRTGYLASVWVCDAGAPVVAGQPQEACQGHGIPGVRVDLPAHPGRAVYQSEAFATDRNLAAMTLAGGVIWQNVAPGDLEALVRPPPGAAGLDCSLWSGSAARAERLPGTNPVRVPLHVSPGAAPNVMLDCKVLR